MALCFYCGGRGVPDSRIASHYQRRHPAISESLSLVPTRWPDGQPVVCVVGDSLADLTDPQEDDDR